MRIGSGLLVVALAGGCGPAATRGAGPGSAGATSPGGGGSGSASSGAGTTDLGIQSINMFVSASAADIHAANRFRGTLMWLRETLASRCLSKQGFRYTPQSAEELGKFDVNTVFPDLERMKATGLFLSESGHVIDPAASVPETQKTAFNQALTVCQKQASTALAPVLKPGRTLEGQWGREVEKAMAEAPVTAAMASFSTCIQKQGVPASSSQNLRNFLAWVDGEMSRTQNDAEFRAGQQKWTRAFVPCAAPVVQTIDGQLAPRKQEFLQTHLDLVHQLQAAVDSTFTAVRNQLDATK